MRIWDIEPEKLCRQHLLGEHRELHATWSILTNNKKGYREHPEVKRWVGKLKALYNRHELLVEDMLKRGYDHRSPLDVELAVGKEVQDQYVDTIPQQVKILKKKGCDCRV